MTPSAGTSQTAQIPARSGCLLIMAFAAAWASPAKSGPAMPLLLDDLDVRVVGLIVFLKPS